MTSRSLLFILLLLVLGGCQGGSDDPTPALLTGRAILPADTFTDGPAVGSALDSLINGRTPPFSGVPVQGFSSLIELPAGHWLALQDNGFGTRANSPRVPLRWYEVSLQLEADKPQGGPVTVHTFTNLTDPHHLVPFPLVSADPERPLQGADFDPESFVRLDDGTFWVGEEFGPFLLHFDVQGRLLTAPVAIPVPGPLRPFNRGSYLLRSPDHPRLREAAEAERLANLPFSGGGEGLARNRDGSLLYVAVEKALVDDPDPLRRTILEFNPESKKFTQNFWFYRADQPGHGLSSLEWVHGRSFLVIERDAEEGAAATFKRIFLVDLERMDKEHFVRKTLVCDLLHIRDSFGFSRAEEVAVGLGAAYSFPYVTPEAVALLDPETLLLCNDNNFPFTTGRRPGQPDDNEFIRLKLPEPLFK